MKTLTNASSGLQVIEQATPEPESGEVVVRVMSAGINRADVLQVDREANGERLGLEFAGVVDSVGAGVSLVAVGARVMGLVASGGQSTHVVVPESHCVPVPENLTLELAGALPEVFVTAWDALVQAEMRPGDRVLINGVGSGVGTAAVQLVQLLGGVSVGTSRTPDKLERAASLGLSEGVLMRDAAPTARIENIDIVLELLGGRYLPFDLDVCRDRARIVVIGRVAGATSELDVGTVMYKRLRLIGTALKPRGVHEKALLARRFHHELGGHFASGALTPVCDRQFSLEDAAEAYDVVRQNDSFGKVVLLPQTS